MRPRVGRGYRDYHGKSQGQASAGFPRSAFPTQRGRPNGCAIAMLVSSTDGLVMLRRSLEYLDPVTGRPAGKQDILGPTSPCPDGTDPGTTPAKGKAVTAAFPPHPPSAGRHQPGCSVMLAAGLDQPVVSQRVDAGIPVPAGRSQRQNWRLTHHSRAARKNYRATTERSEKTSKSLVLNVWILWTPFACMVETICRSNTSPPVTGWRRSRCIHPSTLCTGTGSTGRNARSPETALNASAGERGFGTRHPLVTME
jgi:hypothetical protein